MAEERPSRARPDSEHGERTPRIAQHTLPSPWQCGDNARDKIQAGSAMPSTPDPIELLRKMILIREFDELAIKLRTAGRIYGTVHPYVGEEAIAVGVCA